jgi:hypothetical protein
VVRYVDGSQEVVTRCCWINRKDSNEKRCIYGMT